MSRTREGFEAGVVVCPGGRKEGMVLVSWIDRGLLSLKQGISKWTEAGLCRGEGAW